MRKERFCKSFSIAVIIIFYLSNFSIASDIPYNESNLRVPLLTQRQNNKRQLKQGLDSERKDEKGKISLSKEIDSTLNSYGLSVDDIAFKQLSGVIPEVPYDPLEDRTLTLPLQVANLAALSAYFNRKCAIDPLTGKKYPDASERKKIADGGAVTILERGLEALAEDMDITIILGGSEGKTRDGAPHLEVKQVLNPEGNKGVYIVHSDPIENTNAQAEDKPGAWSLLFFTKLPEDSELLLRRDVLKSDMTLEDFLKEKMGPELAKYNIPFCHDRYVISVSYPGNFSAEEAADFNPVDDPVEILKKIAEEHGWSLDELGKKNHIVFLKGDRTRHDYIENALLKLQESGNEITYTTVSDGDAFARIMACLGIPINKNKKFTIVFGASGAIEGYVAGLVSGGQKSSDGGIIGHIRMVHSSKDIPGNDLSGWNNYSVEDSRDFEYLGIVSPSEVITEKTLSIYPERILIASSITGAREDVDISSDIGLDSVTIQGNKIKVSSFVIDKHGIGFILTTTYNSANLDMTYASLKAENDYGLIDDKKFKVRDYAIRKAIGTADEGQTRLWEERLGVIGLSEEMILWLGSLLDMKQLGITRLSVLYPKEEQRDLDVDVIIDSVLNNKLALEIKDRRIAAVVDKENNSSAEVVGDNADMSLVSQTIDVVHKDEVATSL